MEKLKVLYEVDTAFYHRFGYLIVDNIYQPEECDAIKAEIENHADADFSAIMNLDRESESVRSIMRKWWVVTILEELQGREVVALMSQVLFKKAGSKYAMQAWNPHQDNAYPKAEHGAYITINIFLEDANRENGSLYVYAGSHKEGLLDARPTISFHEAPGANPGKVIRDSMRYGKYPRIDLIFKKGSMLVLHGDLVHGSHPNLSPTRSRPLFSVSYINKGVAFWSGKNAKREAIELRPLIY